MAWTLEQIRERDRRWAATHEAGHVVVAAVKGMSVRAYLYDTGIDSPFDSATFAGRCEYTAACHDTAAEGAVGMAGEVAGWLNEYADWSEVEAEDIAGAVLDAIETGDSGLSPTDLALIPDDWEACYALASEAARVIIEHEQFYRAIVDALLRNGDVSNGEVYDTLHGGPSALAAA